MEFLLCSKGDWMFPRNQMRTETHSIYNISSRPLVMSCQKQITESCHWLLGSPRHNWQVSFVFMGHQLPMSDETFAAGGLFPVAAPLKDGIETELKTTCHHRFCPETVGNFSGWAPLIVSLFFLVIECDFHSPILLVLLSHKDERPHNFECIRSPL